MRLLNSERAEYLVVGGYALALHGHPRATGDLDIWVAVRPENAARIVRALRSFGFSADEAQADLFLSPGLVVRMGVPPLRIELLTGISGVQFDECFARRETVEQDGITVPFISLPDLRANKKAAGRAQDLADLETLGP